jgi:hypothetical protein
LEIEYSETADITDPINMNGEFPEKIDDSVTAL